MRYTKQLMETCKDLGIEFSPTKRYCYGCKKQRYRVVGHTRCLLCYYGWKIIFDIVQVSKIKKAEEEEK